MKPNAKSHSWWLDSQNFPRNSKWLEENLKDMDDKVKAMLKLIDEDADSFAKRAEMYYQKRPELVSLVEEFSRSYKTLAERYNQLTGKIWEGMPKDLQAQLGLEDPTSPTAHASESGSGSTSGSRRKHRAAGFRVFLNRALQHDGDGGHLFNHHKRGPSSASSSSASDEDSQIGKSMERDEAALGRVQHENQQLDLDLEERTSEEYLTLRRRIFDLEAELRHSHSKHRQHAEKLEARIKQLSDELVRLQMESSAFERQKHMHYPCIPQIEELQAEVNRLQEITRLTEIEKSKHAKHQQELDQLHAKLTALHEEKTKLNVELSSRDELLRTLQLQLQQANEALSASDEKCSAHTIDLENLRKALTILQSRLDADASSESQEKHAFKEQLKEEAKKQIETLLEEKNDLQRQYNELESAMMGLQEGVKRGIEHRHAVVHLESELNRVHAELKTKVEQLKSREEQQSSYNSDLKRMEQLVKENQELSSQLKDLDAESERLRQLENSKEELDLLSIKQENLLRDMDRLMSQLAEFKRRVLTLEEEKARLQDISSELEREKSDLHEKLIIGTDHVLELQKQINEKEFGYKQNLDNANKRIQSLLSDVEELGLSMGQKVEKEAKLVEELQNLQKSHMEVEEKLNEIQVSLSHERADASRLREEKHGYVAKLEEEIALLKQSIEDRDALHQELLLFKQQRASLEAELAQAQDIEAHLHCQLKEAELRIRTLLEQCSVVSQKFEAASAEVETLRVQVSDLLEENRRLTNGVMERAICITDMTAPVSDMEKKTSDFEAQLKLKREQSSSLGEQVAYLQQQNGELRHAMSSCSQEMNALKEEREKFQLLHSTLQSEHESVLQDRQRSLGDVFLRLEKVQEELSIQEAENSLLVLRVQGLEGAVSECKKEKQAFLLDIASARATISDLNRRVGDLQSEIGLMRGEIETKSEESERKNREIEGLQEEVIGLVRKLEKKVEDCGCLEVALHEAREDHLLVMVKNKELSEEIDNHQQGLAQLKSENDVLNSDLLICNQEAREDHLLVMEKNKELSEEIDNHQQGLAQLKSEKDALNSDLLICNQDIQRLSMEIFHVRKSAEEWRIALTAKEAEVFLLDNKIEKLKDDKAVAVHDLQNVLENLRKEMDEKEHKHELTMSDFHKDMEQSLERIKSLEGILRSKESELDSLHSDNMRLKDEVATLQEQLGSMQKENSCILSELSDKLPLIREMEAQLTRFKETRVVLDDQTVLSIGDGRKIEEEVSKLMERIKDSARREVELLASLTNLQSEAASLREENKRQRGVILDRAEEKREAIKQLCMALEYWQDKNNRLEKIISSTREKIQRRMQAITAS